MAASEPGPRRASLIVHAERRHQLLRDGGHAAVHLFGGAARRALIDATTAAAGTAVATVVSLPQSILNDRIMGGAHQNLVEALRAVGWRGLYPRTAWTAALCAKVPAYAVNWAAYQGLRRSLSRKGKKLGARADVLVGACAAVPRSAS